jgi:hypothetical protein
MHFRDLTPIRGAGAYKSTNPAAELEPAVRRGMVVLIRYLYSDFHTFMTAAEPLPHKRVFGYETFNMNQNYQKIP